jgi:hypothetical protein
MTSWKKIKNKINSETNDTIYFKEFRFALSEDYVNNLGYITEKGYKLYLSLLGILGKTSVMNAPPRKTYYWFLTIDELKQIEMIKYNEVQHLYELTSRGKGLLSVLAKGLKDQGIPKI